jgi:hypothetical protein
MIQMRDALPVWLALAVHAALYVVGTNLAWRARLPRTGRWGEWQVRLTRWALRLRFGEIIRLIYYLAVPYALLLQGHLSPLDLGLANLDWITGLGWGAALAAGGLVLLLAVWRPFRRLPQRHRTQDARWLAQSWGWSYILREGLYLEAWWALWRVPFVWWLGAYQGTYLGMAAVLAILLLNPRLWSELSEAGAREQLALGLSLAAVSATVYVYTRNWLLCVCTHLLLRATITRWSHPGLERRVSSGPESGEQRLLDGTT